jgi:DNA-binding beta-propeller fold protein YncE
MKPLDKALMAAAGNVGGAAPPSNAWDLDYAELELDSTLLGDVSSITHVQLNETVNIGGNSQGLFFKPDGTKMYIVGSGSDTVKEYTLTTAWDVDTASLAYSLAVGSQEATSAALVFKPDGTKFYIAGTTNDTVYEYDMSTAWDVSTASYNQGFSISTQEAEPRGIRFKPDGTKMFITGSNGDEVNEYDLSTAWDVSTASYSQNFSVSAQETFPQDLFFSDDGETMWILGSSGDDINQYTLSTAWDISTASYSQTSVSLLDYERFPSAMYITSDQKKLFIIGYYDDDIDVYMFGVKQLSILSQEANTNSIFFKDDGTKMYLMGQSGDDINEYNLTTAWDITTASYSQQTSVGTQDTVPQGLYIKSDGTALYMTGSTGDSVYQYSLSTAWDISTLSYVRTFSVSSQQGGPLGVEFKPDGTKMYVCGTTGDRISEYSLSTAWDISTASHEQDLTGLTSNANNPGEVRFKPDGTKFFVTQSVGSSHVAEYQLSTAWDISTATYATKKEGLSLEVTLHGLYVKPDGTKYYVVGRTLDTVYQYAIG